VPLFDNKWFLIYLIFFINYVIFINTHHCSDCG